MQDHRKLRVYAAAQKLGIDVYRVVRWLPASERYALGDQLRRAVVSIGSNIAEGSGRATSRDFCSYLDKALASAREVAFQLGHAEATGLLKSGSTRRAVDSTVVVQKMLTALIVRIRDKDRSGDGELA